MRALDNVSFKARAHLNKNFKLISKGEHRAKKLRLLNNKVEQIMIKISSREIKKDQINNPTSFIQPPRTTKRQEIPNKT
jgi:hypothetical protein